MLGAEQRRRYLTAPRSASTARRSPSTAAFSILRSARAFLDREVVGKAVALGLPSFVGGDVRNYSKPEAGLDGPGPSGETFACAKASTNRCKSDRIMMMAISQPY